MHVTHFEFSFIRYEELLSLLPREVRNNRYCQQLLESLYEAADYLYKNGPEKNISKDRLMEVLAFLEPWELEVPDIEAAVMVLLLLRGDIQTIVGKN